MTLTPSAAFVKNAIEKRHEVESVLELAPSRLQVHREEGRVDDVVIVSEQMLTGANIASLLADNPGISAIVNSGRDRHYSGEAVRRAHDMGIAVLTFGQLQSAVGARQALSAYRDGRMEFMLRTVQQHGAVTRVDQVCERVVLARRSSLRDLRILATSIYTLGVAQLEAELRDHRNVDLVVNLNSYNQYTQDARTTARERGIALIAGDALFRTLGRDGDDLYGD